MRLPQRYLRKRILILPGRQHIAAAGAGRADSVLPF
jgi:hypothetical protein